MTIREKIAHVNATLAEGEPGNISTDIKGYSGYSPQAVIDAMNASFEIGEWGFDEIIPPIKALELEKANVFIANVRVWIATPEGVKLPFQPVAYGEGTQPKSAPGDGMKSAQTDAIKKALSYFSVGSRAYLGLLGKPKAQRTSQQPQQPRAQQAKPAPNGKASDTQTAAIKTLIRMKELNLEAIQKEFGKIDEYSSERAGEIIKHLSTLPTPTPTPATT